MAEADMDMKDGELVGLLFHLRKAHALMPNSKLESMVLKLKPLAVKLGRSQTLQSILDVFAEKGLEEWLPDEHTNTWLEKLAAKLPKATEVLMIADLDSAMKSIRPIAPLVNFGLLSWNSVELTKLVDVMIGLGDGVEVDNKLELGDLGESWSQCTRQLKMFKAISDLRCAVKTYEGQHVLTDQRVAADGSLARVLDVKKLLPDVNHTTVRSSVAAGNALSELIETAERHVKEHNHVAIAAAQIPCDQAYAALQRCAPGGVDGRSWKQMGPGADDVLSETCCFDEFHKSAEPTLLALDPDDLLAHVRRFISELQNKRKEITRP